MLVQNIASEHKTLEFNEKDYEYHNRCVAYSPLSHIALIITQSGMIKIINCGAVAKAWTVGEKMEVSGSNWRSCSLAFLRDPYCAVALDGKGKMVVIEFEAIYRVPKKRLDPSPIVIDPRLQSKFQLFLQSKSADC